MKSAICNHVGVVLLCMAAAACTPRQTAQVSKPPIKLVHFSCQDGRTIAMRFYNGKAVLLADGAAIAMIQTRTADGFRYAGGGQAVRGKGRELRWHDAHGRTILCHALDGPASH